MREDRPYLAGLAILGLALLVGPARTSAQNPHSFNISFQGSADTCAGLNVSSKGETARASEHYTLTRAEAPVLEVHSAERGSIKVMGEDRADFSVDACKVAVAADQATAEQTLRGVTLSRVGGRISASGPSAGSGEWQVYFIVHAPKDARLDLETRNGPISVAAITGSIQARTSNGPLSLADCGGSIDAHTTNGPISFSGAGGDVHLNTTNGPIALKLPGDIWSGPRLEASTTNGPVSLKLPETFQSSLRVETDGRSPMHCGIRACAQAISTNSANQKVMQLNGSSETVRVSTSNGPISVGNSSKTKKLI